MSDKPAPVTGSGTIVILLPVAKVQATTSLPAALAWLRRLAGLK